MYTLQYTVAHFNAIKRVSRYQNSEHQTSQSEPHCAHSMQVQLLLLKYLCQYWGVLVV